VRILFDTHTFIWWDDEHTQLSPTALAMCKDRDNTLLLSIVSIWEMQIKIQLGKLKFSVPLPEKIQHQQAANGLEILPITMQHVFSLDQLPDHHRDPFDRLLIAQSVHENIFLMSSDPLVAKYPVQIIW
jgi:PIN domain nuclease of toxin-antitoxin system